MEVKNIIISKDGKYYSSKRSGGENNPNAKCEFPDFAECHAGKGILGDRFYNYQEDFKGQITFISYELHEQLQHQLNLEIPLDVYRRNVFVTGLDPLTLVGKKFTVGEVQFEGVENCTPCKFMEEFIGDGALAKMKELNSGGLRAKVLSDGILRIGDSLH